jgi:acyl-coenzyme A thioesterase PaaI-like protein
MTDSTDSDNNTAQANPVKVCHGGMLASFADMLLPCVALYQGLKERNFCLNMDPFRLRNAVALNPPAGT